MTTADLDKPRSGRPSGWRSVHFNYVPPDGVDVDDLEEAMIETLARMIGCECTDHDSECKATPWIGIAAPIHEEDDEEEN